MTTRWVIPRFVALEDVRLEDLRPLPRLDTHAATTETSGPGSKRPYGWVAGGSAVALGVGLLAGSSLADLWGAEEVRAPAALPLCAAGSANRRVVVRMGPPETNAAVAGDLDGDGAVDVVFVNQLDESLTLYWGGGAEPLSDPVSVPVGRVSSRPAIGDVDGDGHKDMLVARTDASQLVLLRGGPDRKFTADEPMFQASAPWRVVLMDWDEDGVLDVLLQLTINDRCTAWRRGRGDGTFENHTCIGPQSNVLDPYGLHPPAVYARTDAGTLVRRRRVADGHALGPSEVVADLTQLGAAGTASLVIRDLDRNAEDEIYTPAPGRLVPSLLRIEQGGEVCEVWRSLVIDSSSLADIADINGDGYIDALSRESCQNCDSNHVAVLSVPE